MLPPQLHFFTLACRDVERMAEFFRALGWPESRASEPVHRVFQLPNGVVREPRDSAHGFTGFGFRDPEGNIWEVVWKHGSVADHDGHLTFEP